MQSRNSRPNLTTIDGGSTPPCNLDAEQSILGGILLDPEAIARVQDILSPEMFYMSAHAEIYRAAVSLASKGHVTDLMGVLSCLHDRGSLERIGGQSFLAGLFELTISAVNIDQHALLVREKWQRRQLIKVGADIGAIASDNQQSIEEGLATAEQRLFAIAQGNDADQLIPVGDSIHTVFNQIEERSQGAPPPGIPCGFYDLDALTGGWHPDDFVIIAGRPAQGKTAFALNIASGIAKTARLPIAIFSLEMSAEQLNYRLISAESGIESGRLKSGRVQDREWETLAQSAAAIAQLPIAINDAPNPSVSAIRSKARRYMAESGGKLGGIVIDYIQLMGGADSGNRVQELSQITRQLKQLARELKCPVFGLSQLSRGVESRTNKRPLLSDLRESGSIEQDADLVLMLYRDEYYNPETTEQGIAEIIIAKHRNGPVGTVKLLFDGHITRFRNMAVSHA